MLFVIESNRAGSRDIRDTYFATLSRRDTEEAAPSVRIILLDSAKEPSRAAEEIFLFWGLLGTL